MAPSNCTIFVVEFLGEKKNWKESYVVVGSSNNSNGKVRNIVWSIVEKWA